MRQTAFALALSILWAAPAAAQPLSLSFDSGRVSLDANSVPLRTILTEWARLGGTKVIGHERVSGPPLTLKLVDVPESLALEVVLRSVAGYMAAPRSASATGASMYDRILVMATSSAPQTAASAPRPSTPATRPNNIVRPPPIRPPAQSSDDEPEEEEDPNPPNPPVFTFPQPGQQGGAAQPGTFQNAPQGVSGQPVTTVEPNTGAPQTITINPMPASAMPVYNAPGVVGSPTPGMIVQPPPPQQPRPMVRPPGGF